jgi:hypothetical protein
VTGYIMTTADDNETTKYKGRNPYSWTLYGSMDGSTWYEIDQKTKDSTMKDINFTSFYFDVDNSIAYSYYKLQITSVQSAKSDKTLQLSEFALRYEKADPCATHSYKNGYCTVCGEAHTGHTGGQATCVALAQCETCGIGYGNLIDHDFKDYICQACGAVIINEVTFPDATFRQYISENCDKDSDGILANAEIAASTSIVVSEKGISDLTGIAYFTALETLKCDSNNLTSLDVSKNTELKTLYCNKNSLTSLDVSNNTQLEDLNCQSNYILSFDFSANNKLTRLQYGSNKYYVGDVDCSGVIDLTSIEGFQFDKLASWNDASYDQITKKVTVNDPSQGEVKYSRYVAGWNDGSSRYCYLTFTYVGHVYESVVTAPTCTTGGYTTYTCKHGDDTYTGDETKALGHSYSYTDNNDGVSHKRTCANESTTASFAHTYKNGKCTACGYKPEEVKTYGVTVYVDGTQDEKQTKTYDEGTVVTVKASVVEGKTFSHWALSSGEGSVLSYSESYSFRAVSAISLYAVYTSDAQEITQLLPTIAMTDVHTSGTKIVYEATRDVPTGYTVVETGILYGTSAAYLGNSQADANLRFTNDDGSTTCKTKVYRSAATSTKNLGCYILAINVGTNTDRAVYVRGYVIVKDAAGNVQTFYSDVTDLTYNQVNNQ